MKKKIEWVLMQGNGETIFLYGRRDRARAEKKWYESHIFDDGFEDITLPLKIVRREYHLVDEKVVR